MHRIMNRTWMAVLCLAWLAHPAAVPAEEEKDLFVENEWNFVENSMDISGGIPEDAEGRLRAIREAGVLTVATEPYFPPQEFIDPSLSGQERFKGSDMELARRIAERMGVELSIVPLEFADVLSSVADGEYDLAISALSYTPFRAGMLTLSKGYYYADLEDTNGLLIREEDLDEIHALEDLAGRNIIAQRLSLQESLGAEHIEKYHEFRRVSQVQEVYAALEEGSADAAVVDMESAEAYMANNPDCGLALVPGISFSLDEAFEGDRIAARKGEIPLICFVNGVIDELLESGEYQEWFEEYTEYAAKLE